MRNHLSVIFKNLLRYNLQYTVCPVSCFKNSLKPVGSAYISIKRFSRQYRWFCVQAHPWVTKQGAEPLPPEDDNCSMLIEVTEEEVENSVKHIPSLATVVGFSVFFVFFAS